MIAGDSNSGRNLAVRAIEHPDTRPAARPDETSIIAFPFDPPKSVDTHFNQDRYDQGTTQTVDTRICPLFAP
ncbi:hypothetical protein [Actinosynnema sp. NPDC023587]|uniref:hypothetical protein n=1 Tax=Actinosynnema sp. NPDC023587 TaxID=3154695 RepID=UPI0033C1AC9A